MDGRHFFPSVFLCVFESKADNSLRSENRKGFDADAGIFPDFSFGKFLDFADDFLCLGGSFLKFNPRVKVFGVFTDND